MGFINVLIYLVIEGIRLLRMIGRPNAQRKDDGLSGIEKTTQLVSVGLYSKIRHPLYSSLICLAWGAFFKSTTWLGSC
jgi:protein-S-isoprenylcysteine O-methyltransferase Ste14